MDMDTNTDNSMSPQDAIYEQFLEEERRATEEKNKVLEQVKSVVSENLYTDILTYLSILEYSYNYRIENSPIGSIQLEEEFEQLNHIYITQSGGGMTGDDFWGTISIEISKDTYFIFEYNC
jgi:hypothetical protein